MQNGLLSTYELEYSNLTHRYLLRFGFPNAPEMHLRLGCQYTEYVIGVNEHAKFKYTTWTVFLCTQIAN